jgi:hypothetical protein
MDVARRMGVAVDVYFSQLADRVVERAGKATTPPTPPHPSAIAQDGEGRKDDFPNAGDLLNADDAAKLASLIKRFYVEILSLSWETLNLTLGVDLAFDLGDPLVGQLMKMAAANVKEINDVTRAAIREALQYGADNGWSIDQLVRGDETYPGLRDIVDEVYQGRARTIARTELGNAQNAATAARYRQAGVKLVEILDGDVDAQCKIANGQIWTVDYFAENRLQHPNCVRAAAPVFEDVEPDRG